MQRWYKLLATSRIPALYLNGVQFIVISKPMIETDGHALMDAEIAPEGGLAPVVTEPSIFGVNGVAGEMHVKFE
jgi:hypothetical protein